MKLNTFISSTLNPAIFPLTTRLSQIHEHVTGAGSITNTEVTISIPTLRLSQAAGLDRFFITINLANIDVYQTLEAESRF